MRGSHMFRIHCVAADDGQIGHRLHPQRGMQGSGMFGGVDSLTGKHGVTPRAHAACAIRSRVDNRSRQDLVKDSSPSCCSSAASSGETSSET